MKLTADDFRAVAKDAVERAARGLQVGYNDGLVLSHIERAVAAMEEALACRDADKKADAALSEAIRNAPVRKASPDPYA